MIGNIDPSAERFLADLERIRQAGERATREISSGLRVSTASDAPDQISDILQLRADLARNAQIRVNLTRVKSEVDTAERTLEHSARLLDRALVLAVQGATSTATAESRRILAGEVEAILEQLVAASRTLVGGRFVFSGDRDQEPAYQLNLANPNGVDRLFSVQATRRIDHPSGTSFAVAKTAEEIFDNRNADDTLAADNVFAAINSLRLALETDDQVALDASLTAIRQASDHLNTQLSFYGAVQNKVEEAIEFAARFELQLKGELSAREDADLAAAALELQRSRTHEQASLSARAGFPQTSLFDYLD